jgi:hypothetical protein
MEKVSSCSDSSPAKLTGSKAWQLINNTKIESFTSSSYDSSDIMSFIRVGPHSLQYRV